jgi:hypothetical protein
MSSSKDYSITSVKMATPSYHRERRAKHLIRGANKPVRTMVLIAALIDAGVDFVRII